MLWSFIIVCSITYSSWDGAENKLISFGLTQRQILRTKGRKFDFTKMAFFSGRNRKLGNEHNYLHTGIFKRALLCRCTRTCWFEKSHSTMCVQRTHCYLKKCPRVFSSKYKIASIVMLYWHTSLKRPTTFNLFEYQIKSCVFNLYHK